MTDFKPRLRYAIIFAAHLAGFRMNSGCGILLCESVRAFHRGLCKKGDLLLHPVHINNLRPMLQIVRVLGLIPTESGT